jgi:DNA-binding MarR family transcriptional regulator
MVGSRPAPSQGPGSETGRDTRALDALDGGRSALRPRDLDRLIHQRTRLSIVSALAVSETLSFNDLKAALRTSDGNVSVHARKLEDAGYLECTKSFAGRTPRTEYRLTDEGRAALEAYLGHMAALIDATREQAPEKDPRKGARKKR